MSEFSIFMDKQSIPTNKDLLENLGDTYRYWLRICGMVYNKYPEGKEEWNFPGKKYGWSFRIKDKKRAILYLLPLKGYFKVAMVFGQKAVDQVMSSDIEEEIKSELKAARKYAEGRGVRIDIKDGSRLNDVEKMVEIKLNN